MKKSLLFQPSYSVAVIIPAHNEAVVIAATIEKLLTFVPGKDIYVADDCSTDKTSKIAGRYPVKCLTLVKNRGKAGAINTAIDHFRLVKRYRYLMPIDADTQIDSKFFEQALPLFKTRKRVAAVVGRVMSQQSNWLTAYRMWEYEIGQTVHKAAQGLTNGIIACPGCATVYRADIFKKVKFPEGTWTEDMDLTFLIHRLKLGSIRFAPEARVYTQDPQTLKVWTKQVKRWYMGFWQTAMKHGVPWGGQLLDVEVALAGTEGLLNGLIGLIWLAFLPWGLYYNLRLSLVPLALDLGLFMVPTLAYTAWKHGTWKIFIYSGHFYFIRLLSS